MANSRDMMTCKVVRIPFHVLNLVGLLPTMIRQHGNNTEVEDCLRENFMDVETMREIGVDEFHIEVLEPIVKEIERKKSLVA